MGTETRVGIFAAAGMVLIGTAIFLLGDFSFKSEYPVTVRFKDVAGLPEKANVKLSGVLIGKVKAIEMDGTEVVVTLALQKNAKIYRDAVFKIGSTSVIGSKFLQIDQGSPSSGLLAAGAQVRGSAALPLDQMLTETLTSVKKLVDDLSNNGQFASQLNGTMNNVRQLTANLNDLIATASPHMTSTMEHMDSLTAKLDQLMAKADSLMTDLQSGKGAIGALMTDQKMKEDVKETLANVKETTDSAKKMLGRLGGFRVAWSYENLYEPQIENSRSNLGLRISPRKGRYYYLGVSNIGNPNDQPRRPDYVEKNRLDARLGWENNAYDFYAGLLHGGGGIGMRLKPLYDRPFWDRFSVLGEAYDFTRRRTINGRFFDTPVYMVGGEFRLHRMIALGMRSSDIAGTGNTQYTATVTFEDKDLSYLLGIVTLGTMTSRGSGGD